MTPSTSYACPKCAAQPLKPCEEGGQPVAYVHSERVEQAIGMAGEGDGELVPVTDKVLGDTELF